MDAQTFLDNFGTIADAPGGVERLRELIVLLAMQGKLVQQSADDYPASLLLEQIESEREGRLASGSRRGRRTSAPPSPMLVPSGWSSTDLGSVIDLDYGKSLPASVRRTDGSVPVFGSNGIVGHHDKHLVAQPCVIVGRKGSSGAINLSQVPSWPIDTTYYVVPYAGMSTDFVALMLTSLHLDELDRATAVPGLNREDAYSLSVGLPPLAEQARIVAKVDELMQLCDELEASQQARHHVTTRLRASSLDALTNAASDDDLRIAWSRIHTNWEALTDHPDSIDALRRTILQLAVEGRLAAADPADTSADELLERIEPGSASRAAVDPSRTPYTVPANWRWVFLEYVCSHIVDCLHKTPHYVENGYRTIRTADVEPGRILLERARHVDQQTFEERTSRLRPAAGDVVYSREGGRFGIAAVVPPDVDLCLGQRMMQFRCAEGVEPEYLCWFLNSPLGFGQASAEVGGSASPHVNIKAIRRFLLPLPPSAEQRRIVWRVRELMGQCDRLEARLGARDRVGSLLAGSMASAVAG